MKRRGFTIVEIMIVIAMIIILTVLGVASLRSSQVSARDDQRQVKAEIIARGLEGFYRRGDPSRGIQPGRYPSNEELQAAMSGGYITEWLNGSDNGTFRYDWQDELDTNLGFLGATTSPQRDQTENSSNISAAVADDKIIYEPLAAFVGSRPSGDNDIWASCQQISTNTPTCSRYNLYYQRELDGTIVTIRSDHQ